MRCFTYRKGTDGIACRVRHLKLARMLSPLLPCSDGPDGACVRVAPVPTHNAVLTLHANGALILRNAADLTVIKRKQTCEAAYDGKARAFDLVCSHDASWCAVSVCDGVANKVALFELPSLACKSDVTTSLLPTRALAISPDDRIMYVCTLHFMSRACDDPPPFLLRCCGSDDHRVLCVLVSDVTQCWVCAGVKAEVKSLSVRTGLEAEQYLIACGAWDGVVRVWRVCDGDAGSIVAPLCSRECMPVYKRGDDALTHRQDVYWCPVGPPSLTIPGDGAPSSLVPVEQDMSKKSCLTAWKLVPASPHTLPAPLAVCVWSADGARLAACDTKGQVCVWGGRGGKGVCVCARAPVLPTVCL